MGHDIEYCDECGLLADRDGPPNYISELPVNIDSANKGESAVLCKVCFEALHRTFTVVHYREVRTFFEVEAFTEAEALKRAEEAHEKGGYPEGEEPDWLKSVQTEDNDAGDFEIRQVQ